jgi:acetyl-CoA acetyltransferase
MVATAHMARYGTTPEQLAQIAVAARENAQRNPDAIFHGRPVTVDDVLASPLIAEPLHLLEAVMPCAGGAAFVMTSATAARALAQPPVALLGAGEKVTHRALSQAPSLTSSPLKQAIADARTMARVAVRDIDVFSLYDCYTIMVGVTLEDAGVCPPGQFGPFVAASDLSPTGDLPLNTHGGQLGCGQADLAGGMSHIVEAVRQLRGAAVGRQVPDARLALVTGNGATLGEECALILGGEL